MPEGRRACCNGTVSQTADLPRRDVDLDVRGPLLMAVVGLLLLQIDLVDAPDHDKLATSRGH